MFKPRHFVWAICAAALRLVFVPSVPAQLIKINAGYSAISGDALPAWLAKDASIFARNGLDVPLVFCAGGTTAVMALVSADTPIAQLAGPAVVNSVIAGSDATLIACGVISLNCYLMTRIDLPMAREVGLQAI